MSCGYIAIKNLGIPIKRYVAYEIDKYAIETSKHNFNDIEHRGDVFGADFTEFKGFDLMCGGSPCFTKGHLVFTDKGYKDISEIEVGDMVLTHKNRFKKVIDTGSKYANVYELSVMGYPKFRVTKDHPFYTIKRNRTWDNDKREYVRYFSDEEWVPVCEFHKDTFCGMHITNNHVKDLDFDDELLWLFGRYVADGHVRKSKRKHRKDSYQYQLILSIGESKLDDFKKHIKSRHYSCYKHSQSVYRCVFSSMELVNFVIDNNFGTTASKKRIPQFIMDLPSEKLEVFLDGYMSGDGSYDKKTDSYSASTVSKELAFQLQRVSATIYNTNSSVSVYGNRDKKHYIDGREIHNNFDQYTVQFKKGLRKQSVAHEQNGIMWTQFKSISEDCHKDIVYNISVEDDESYTVNNCIVHNCTHWSIAQKKDRETQPNSGLGWELFSQYVRALNEAKPKYFLYENNKSMSKAIRAAIDEAFGFEAICINSALVSAQNRNRLYWVGKLNDDGCTYSKVEIDQPEDKGILLKDIIEDNCIVDADKSYVLKHQAGNARDYLKKHHTQVKFEPIKQLSENEMDYMVRDSRGGVFR